MGGGGEVGSGQLANSKLFRESRGMYVLPQEFFIESLFTLIQPDG
jgi:hypothetical protein